MLTLNGEQQIALAALNASGEAGRRLEAMPLGDGRGVLNADLLADCGPGQTWAHYGALLGGLGVEVVALAPGRGL